MKDNRIPPAGFTAQALGRRSLAPVPVGLYQPGQDYAEFIFDGLPSSVVSVTAVLYYQTASKEYIDFLAANGGLDAQTVKQLWFDIKSPPELVAWGAFPVFQYFYPVVLRK